MNLSDQVLAELEQLRVELAAVRAEGATLRRLVVGAGRLEELAELLALAHRAFGASRWTIGHLVDAGLVAADQRVRLGKFLADHANVEAGGMRLVPVGSVANARAWAVRVERSSSLPTVDPGP